MEPLTGQSERSQRKSQYFVVATITAIMFVSAALVLGISLLAHDWSWTGFNGGYTKVTITETTPSTTATVPSKTVATEQSPPKTLWDVLQLLIVPLVLAGVGLWFSQAQKKNEQKIAKDDLSENALQNYIDKVSDILIQYNSYALESSDKSKAIDFDQVQEIVRMRTLTVLPRLDSSRKKYVLQLLCETNLISTRNSPSVNLENADFSEADLKEGRFNNTNLKKIIFDNAQLDEIELKEAVLEEAHLKGANLFYATLHNLHLENAILDEAKLRSADLKDAWLAKASLINADLTDAILTNADLTNANLTNADLTNANLTNAVVSVEQLKVARNVSSDQLCSIRPEAKQETNTNKGPTDANPTKPTMGSNMSGQQSDQQPK